MSFTDSSPFNIKLSVPLCLSGEKTPQKRPPYWRIILLLLILSLFAERVAAQTVAQIEEPTPVPDDSAIPLVYTVQDGENLTIIAQNFGVTVEELLTVNGLAEDALLFVGQSLIIPGGEGEAVATVYSIQLGDTLAGVAAAFQTTTESILNSNQLINPNYSFRVGQSPVVVSRTGSALPAPVLGRPHVVVQGESLRLLAMRYNLTLNELAEANELAVDAVLFARQRLRIPAETPYRFLPGEWVDVRIRPFPIVQGDTVSIYAENLLDGQPSGQFAGQTLHFFPHEAGWAALVGIDAFTEPDVYTMWLEGNQPRPWQPFQQDIQIQSGQYGTQLITIPEEKSDLLAPEIRQEENAFLATIYTRFSETPLWDGVFQIPVTNTFVTAPYGDARSYNGGPFDIYHSGIDFSGTIGTPILASANGTVVFTGTLKLRGQTVIVDHGVGVMSAYFHMSEIFVNVEDSVTLGQPLGVGGSTGFSTGPHLHWDLRILDVPVNGEKWLEIPFP